MNMETVNEKVSLDQMRSGSWVIIQSIDGDKKFVRRAAGRGFTPEAALLVVQNFGIGPLIVFLCDTQVALGRGEAKKIIVRRRQHECE